MKPLFHENERLWDGWCFSSSSYILSSTPFTGEINKQIKQLMWWSELPTGPLDTPLASQGVLRLCCPRASKKQETGTKLIPSSYLLLGPQSTWKDLWKRSTLYGVVLRTNSIQEMFLDLTPPCPRVYSDSKMIGKQDDSRRNPSHWGIWWVTVSKI